MVTDSRMFDPSNPSTLADNGNLNEAEEFSRKIYYLMKGKAESEKINRQLVEEAKKILQENSLLIYQFNKLMNGGKEILRAWKSPTVGDFTMVIQEFKDILDSCMNVDNKEEKKSFFNAMEPDTVISYVSETGEVIAVLPNGTVRFSREFLNVTSKFISTLLSVTKSNDQRE